MENVDKIIALVGSIVALISIIVSFAIPLILNIKKVIENKQWGELLSLMSKFVIEAENFTELNGVEKKDYVLKKLTDYAEQKNFSCNTDKLLETIDSLIEITKKVNIEKTN